MRKVFKSPVPSGLKFAERRRFISGTLAVGASHISVGSALIGLRPSHALASSSEGGAQSAPGAELQRAINSGVAVVEVSAPVSIASTVYLAANQTLKFAGNGSLVLTRGFKSDEGAIHGKGLAATHLVRPVIDASATAGAAGIVLVDCSDPWVEAANLTKCSIVLHGNCNTTIRNYRIDAPKVNLAGFMTTALYISGIKGCRVLTPTLFGGKEGVGIYNGARDVGVNGGHSYGHSGDGFIIFNGQDISLSGMEAYQNGQSGFATQRFTSAENCRRVTVKDCSSHHNKYDGFDLRGGIEKPFAEPYDVTVDSCKAWKNEGTGFYVVNAGGAYLKKCNAANNALQGFAINTSDGVELLACEASGNAGAAKSSGGNKSGIWIYNSRKFIAKDCVSDNALGLVQDYALGFSGDCPNYFIDGGRYVNGMQGVIYKPAGSAGSIRI